MEDLRRHDSVFAEIESGRVERLKSELEHLFSRFLCGMHRIDHKERMLSRICV